MVIQRILKDHFWVFGVKVKAKLKQGWKLWKMYIQIPKLS